MKKWILFASLLPLLMFSFRVSAYEEDAPPQNPGNVYEEEKLSGWFLGSDQGILFFVGNSAHFIGPQYYGTLFGGYNIKGIFQPMLRLGNAVGNANAFFNPTTFFFTVEAAFKVTPIARGRFSPYFLGSLGMYILNFDDFGSPVRQNTNLTFAGGGGLEVRFGGNHNHVTIGSEYRGFVNSGPDLRSVDVTLGYAFQF